MFDTTDVIGLLNTVYTDVGLMLGVIILGTLAGTAALLGLAYGVDQLCKLLGNDPQSFAYNPRVGSGMSRFQRGRRNAEGGANLLA